MRSRWEDRDDERLDEPVTITERQLRALRRGARIGAVAMVLALAATGLAVWSLVGSPGGTGEPEQGFETAQAGQIATPLPDTAATATAPTTPTSAAPTPQTATGVTRTAPTTTVRPTASAARRTGATATTRTPVTTRGDAPANAPTLIPEPAPVPAAAVAPKPASPDTSR